MSLIERIREDLMKTLAGIGIIGVLLGGCAAAQGNAGGPAPYQYQLAFHNVAESENGNLKIALRPSGNGMPDARTVLGELWKGPTETERALGVQSEIPASWRVVATQDDGRRVLVRIKSDDSSSLAGTKPARAVEQIVNSLAETLSEVRIIVVCIDGYYQGIFEVSPKPAGWGSGHISGPRRIEQVSIGAELS